MDMFRKYSVAVVLLFFLLAARSYMTREFWFDESLTLLNFALLPLEKIYSNYAIPNNHIGYTMLLHCHRMLAPETVRLDVWCRLLSLGLAAVFIIRWWSSFKGFAHRVCLLCFVTSLPFVIYATGVRGYMAALLFSVLALDFGRKFIVHGKVKYAVGFFFSSFACASVLPSDLFLLGATVFAASGVLKKRFVCEKKFYILGALASAAFLLFWGALIPQVIAASRLGEGWHDRWSSLFAGAVSFTACAPIVVICAIASCAVRKQFGSSILSFFCVLPLVFCAKVAPFPRVYFPFFGVFLFVVSNGATHLLALMRYKKLLPYKKMKAIFALCCIGAALLVNYLPSSQKVLSQINGTAVADDFFTPWYTSKEHRPDETARFLALQKAEFCYLSFSSDPWSIMFYTAVNGKSPGNMIFDGPRGRIEELKPGWLAVINKSEDVSTLESRFKMSFTEIGRTPMHKIYRAGF
ncbi:MAG: hypothetical protein IJW08_09545 [Lentisphaeria bacterium]|nr:hypothetical protein [Lentisphaeria bacterium]